MTGGLAWLNDLMLWLGKWFPRVVLIKAGYVGVKFGRRGRVSRLEPNLYCYWPITTDITVVSTRERTNEIATQLMGREAMAVVTVYTITRPELALVAYTDVFSQLDDRTQAILGTAYDAAKSSPEICRAVLAQLTAEFAPGGIAITAIDTVSRGRVIPLKNLNDWAQHAKAEL